MNHCGNKEIAGSSFVPIGSQNKSNSKRVAFVVNWGSNELYGKTRIYQIYGIMEQCSSLG